MWEHFRNPHVFFALWGWGKPDAASASLHLGVGKTRRPSPKTDEIHTIFLIYVGGETIRPPNENHMFLEATGAVLEAQVLFWKPQGPFWKPQGLFWKPQGLFWRPQRLFWSPQGLFWSPLELF